MPKLSGFEVCKQLKDDPATKRVMVLMVTALNELGDIERAVAAGTDDFLSKPVNKVELLKRVENMLKLKGVEDELERLRRYIQEWKTTTTHNPATRDLIRPTDTAASWGVSLVIWVVFVADASMEAHFTVKKVPQIFASQFSRPYDGPIFAR